VSDGKEQAELKGPASGINGMSFSPDGSTLAITTRQQGGRLTAGEVWLFNKAENGEFTRGPVLKGHKFPLLCCAWSPDGKRLASGGGQFRQPGEVIVWDVAARKPLVTLGGHREWVETVAFNKDGTRLLTAGGSNDLGEALLWDIDNAKGWSVADAHAGELTCAAWSPDCKKLLTGGTDGAVRVWDGAAGERLAEWKGAHKGMVRCIAFTNDGSRVATCGGDRVVKVWDAASGEMIKALPTMKQMTMAAAWSPDGKWLAVATGDPTFKDRAGAVFTFDTAAWKPGKSIHMADQAAQSVAFSPDGKKLAVGGLGTDSVAVYDAADGKRLVVMKGASSVRCLCWSPDGKRLATGNGSGGIHAWDAATGREEAALTGHTAQVLGLAFGPDGRIGSASNDGSVMAWEKVE
jgi:WD40 repeat protein